MTKPASDEIEDLISELQLDKAGPALTLHVLQQEISSVLTRWQSMQKIIAQQLESIPSEKKNADILMNLRAENRSLQAKLAKLEKHNIETDALIGKSSPVILQQPCDSSQACPLTSLESVPEVVALPGTIGDADMLGRAKGVEVQLSDTTLAEDDRQLQNAEHLDSGPPRRPSMAMFPNEIALKEQLKDALRKDDFSVNAYYHKTGWCQKIAKSPTFEVTTLAVIFLNACWMWVDTDLNDSALLIHAEVPFVIAENLFCIFFTMEWLVRFGAFKTKWNCFRDSWFMFDSFLLAGAIFETWILTLVFASIGSEVHYMLVRVIRLFRFSRMARMVRLFRAAPELLVMVKAMSVALRSVFFTLCLLLCIVYVFAIVFTQLLQGKSQDHDTFAYKNFRSVSQSISTLLLKGALPDQADIIEEVGKESFAHYFLMLIYMFVVSLTVLNMLVGVLCEVISVVSSVEREEILLETVKDKLAKLLQDSKIDVDESGTISKSEFKKLLQNKAFSKTLAELTVDVVGLVDLVDYIFEQSAEMSFNDFMEVIADLRGTKLATVKDIVALRNLVMRQMSYLKVRFDDNEKSLGRLSPTFAA